jgi:serine/threonine protein kinase/tetratricopeptide (TPR) repeat protein
MEPKPLRRIEELFHAALEIEKDRRADFVRQACGNDKSLHRAVESLLAYQSEARDFIEAPAMELAARGLAREEDLMVTNNTAERTSWLPERIGHYRVIRLLGEGGMGAVYEAEQEQPRRIVALKVIRPGLATPELLRRFDQEAQALARLQHPGIAQIYEAGTADTGLGPQPYFAMELIRGNSLRDYAEQHRLDTRQRLELMVRICEAVEHAHQRGLIHRDLKPGNILVDETGQPKILDFGVARVTDGDKDATRQTDLGQLVGTLAYMSPEQVLANPLDLDTRSDVYALGVILYELLAGRLPYDLSAKPHDAGRIIREEDPSRLSSISLLYRGDIETIVAKALEKDKERRYASASGLAADIHRYLKDEPIAARPPSASYQLRKFAQRHRALVASTTAVFLVLVIGIIASTWEATRARRAERTAIDERNRANNEAAATKAVSDFVQNDLLAQASSKRQARPDMKPDPNLTVRTALDRAAARIPAKFADRPLLEASIRQTIGNTYSDLGLYPDAERQMEQALDLRRRVLGEQHADTLMSLNNLAALYLNQGKHGQAEPLFTRLLELRRRVLGEDHIETLRTMNNLAVLYVYEGQYARAEPLYTRVLEIKRRVLGAEHPSTLTGMSNLGTLYGYEGKYALVEPLFTKAFEARQRVLGGEHPDTLVAMTNLATFYADRGRYDRAESLDVKALEILRRVAGEQHPDTLRTMYNLAAVYRRLGKYDESDRLFTKTLAGQRQVLGEDHRSTLDTMWEVVLLYQDQGKYAQAKRLGVKNLDVQHRAFGDENPDTLDIMEGLGFLYLKQDEYAQAEAMLRKALTGYQKILSNTWRRYDTESMLGAALSAQRKYAEAEGLVLSGYRGLLEREAALPASERGALERAGKSVVQLYRDWRKPEQAAEWGGKLEAAKLSAAPARR